MSRPTSNLIIDESPDALLITLRRATPTTRVVVRLILPVVFVLIAAHTFVSSSDWRVLIVASVAVTAFSGLQVLRKRTIELKITSEGFKSKGYAGNEIRLTRKVTSDEVQWLEFQSDWTSPESSYHPNGLYAVLNNHNICLIPYIDERQANEVIARILRKFPDLEATWKRNSAFGRHLIQLNLR